MNGKMGSVAAMMVFIGMLSVFALPMVTAEDDLDIALDDNTIECNQTVWIRVVMDARYEDAPAYCNLTDPHDNVYNLGLVELDKDGLGNWSYNPDCTGGTWIVNVTVQIGYLDGGEWESVLLTFTMESQVHCLADSITDWIVLIWMIFVILIILLFLVVIMDRVNRKSDGSS